LNIVFIKNGTFKNTTEIASDTTIEGDYLLASDERVVLKNNATLTVTGAAVLEGEVTCQDGALKLVVEGDLTTNDKLSCEAGENDAEAAGDILIVAKGSITFGEKATVESDGSVQIVESADQLATTEEALDKVFEDGLDTTEALLQHAIS